MEFDILTAISTVGFPIVASMGLGYLLYKEQQFHKQETDSLKEAINNNTTMMAEMKQLIMDINLEKKHD